jgi:hypothetical protein
MNRVLDYIDIGTREGAGHEGPHGRKPPLGVEHGIQVSGAST